MLSADPVLLSLSCIDIEKQHSGLAAGTILQRGSTANREIPFMTKKDSHLSS